MNLYTKDDVEYYMQKSYNIGKEDLIQEGLFDFFNSKKDPNKPMSVGDFKNSYKTFKLLFNLESNNYYDANIIEGSRTFEYFRILNNNEKAIVVYFNFNKKHLKNIKKGYAIKIADMLLDDVNTHSIRYFYKPVVFNFGNYKGNEKEKFAIIYDNDNCITGIGIKVIPHFK